MKERRKFVRADTMANIRWSKDTGKGKEAPKHQDVTRNIGGGGVCIIVKNKLEFGDKLQLEITLPKLKIIHAKGTVVWTKEFEIGLEKEITKGYYAGVEFTDISEEDRKLVEEYVFEYFHHISFR